MHIAICDNDASSLKALKNLLSKYGIEKERDLYVDGFSSSDRMLKAISKGNYYDIIFWDDTPNGMKCINIAVYLREKLHCDQTLLVFPLLYAYALVQHLYRIGPVTFTEKTFQPDGLYYLFDYFCYQKRQNFVFVYTYKKQYVKVHHRDIVYFENNKRKMLIHLVTETQQFIATTKNVMDQLQGSSFLQLHHGYIVNMDYIRSITSKSAVLTGGQVLPISNSRSAGVRSQFQAYTLSLPKEFVHADDMDE